MYYISAMHRPITIRADEQTASVLRSVAAAVKADPALAKRVLSVVGGPVAPRRGRTGSRAGVRTAGPLADERFTSVAAVEDLIRSLLTAQLDPDALILFGSRARGDARPDSDWDIAVLLPEGGRVDPEDDQAVYRPLLGSGIAVDIVPCPTGAFEHARVDPLSFAHRIDTEGKVIYGRHGTAWWDRFQHDWAHR